MDDARRPPGATAMHAGIRSEISIHIMADSMGSRVSDEQFVGLELRREIECDSFIVSFALGIRSSGAAAPLAQVQAIVPQQ
jgi:hypothetical protein